MKVILELIAKSEKFQAGFQQGERVMGSFRQAAQKTGQFVSELTQKIGFLGNAATALSTGLVLKKLFSVSDYMPIDDALLRMRVNLKANSAEMDIFKKKLASMAGETGMNIGETFQGANKLSLIYPQNDILEIMKASDKASKAMGEPIDVIQDRVVQVLKLYRLTAKEAPGVADALVASRANVESLDILMQRLAVRGGSKKEYTQTLGMLRGLNMAGLSSPRVLVQLNTTLQAIQDKADVLESSGIKVRKVTADGTVEWRDQLEVLKDLETYLARWRKKVPLKVFDEKLNQVFGPNARQNLDFVFKQKDNFKKGIEEIGHAAEISTGRAGAATETWENQLNKIKGHLGGIKTDMSFIYDLAKKPVKFFADSPTLTKTAGYAAAGLSVGILGALAFGNIKNVLKTVGKTGVGIAEGKAIEAATGIAPVFVTNWPAGGIGGLPGVVVPGGSISKLALLAGKASLIAGAGVAGYEAGSYLNKQFGDLAGELSHNKYKGEGWLGDMLYDFLHKVEKPEVKNDIKLNINIDKEGRVIADTGDAGLDLAINLLRGNFFTN